MGVLIRPEAPSDAGAIEAVTVAAFLDAPHTDHTEHFIVNALRSSGQVSISLVAALAFDGLPPAGTVAYHDAFAAKG